MYDVIRRLLLMDGHLCIIDRDTAPMNKYNLKLHRGTDNTLYFRVFGPDGVPVNLCAYSLFARFIDTHSGEIILEKICYTGTALGMVTLEVDEGDMNKFSEGLYNMVILAERPFVANATVGEMRTIPLYSDLDRNLTFVVEVTGQAIEPLKRSHVITQDDWTPVDNTLEGSTMEYYSSAITGNRLQNHINGTHTYSVFAENFTGTLEIFGTLEETPNPDLARGWARIYPSSGTDRITFINFTGTEAFEFQANIMWLKFRYTPDPDIQDNGTINKIIART